MCLQFNVKSFTNSHGPFDIISVPIDVISVIKNERFLLYYDDVIIQKESHFLTVKT